MEKPGILNKKNDPVLAKVYGKTLNLSDLEGVVADGVSTEDSTLYIQAFIDRWVREQVLMHEAELHIPKDLNIDKMVRDYRASLVQFNYEENIAADNLDSLISEEEIKSFYEVNPDQFQLESTILKCFFIKVPSDKPINQLNRLWYSKKRSDQRKLERFAKEHAKLALLSPEKWYKIDEIAALLPQGTLTAGNVFTRKEGTLSEDGFRYYYRILESVRSKETAPYDYVREQASKIILHRRKQELLEHWKDSIYTRNSGSDNVKIY